MLGPCLALACAKAFVCVAVSATYVQSEPLFRATAENPPQFAADIRPIFAEHCLECHGPNKQSSGLRLDRKESILTGGDFGEPAVVPGEPNASPLLAYVRDRDHTYAMPPPGDDRRGLSPEEIAILEAWIAAGADWSDSESVENLRTDHWSFQSLQRTFDSSSIDAFLNARMQSAGLSPAPIAPPQTVIRRLYHNLIGLPPEPTRVQRFVNDWARDQDAAVAELVEELLASPHYGERWARHWLDVVRFAESDGFEMNNPRPTAWHYRDYVIEAFNSDLPYNQFVGQQIAGDQLGDDRATGFLVGGPWDRVKSPDPVLTANQRADELHDMVNTTGTAFLGLTIGCARCHSHKFDPISHTDYYRIKACLSGVQHGERQLPVTDRSDRARDEAQWNAELAMVVSQLRDFEPMASPRVPTESSSDPKSITVASATSIADSQTHRAPITHRENIDRFSPIVARFVRFEIMASSDAEPCIDELEIFSTDGVNVARNAAVISDGDYQSNPSHRLSHVHDGLVGNEHSWISNRAGEGTLEFDLGAECEIDRVVWSRDRSPIPVFSDRIATNYRICVARQANQWIVVADASDRTPRLESGSFDPARSLDEESQQHRQQLQDQRMELERRIQQSTDTPRAYAGVLGTPEPVHRFMRGDPTQPKDRIAPGGLKFLDGFELKADVSDPERRLALAEWVRSPTNPLTTRVMVNRIWHYHFGCGIVDTPSDFGAGGGRPSHPELLDWLSVQLIEQGWSVKAIQRLICNSQAMRRSSVPSPDSLARDQANRYLSYFTPLRMEAEPLRDAILWVSGQLNPQMSGPGFDLFEPNDNYVRVFETKTQFSANDFRRMVYQQKPRVELDQLFGAFDCPDAGQIQPRRTVSTTPLQALSLLNSQFILDQSTAFARRLEEQAGDRIEYQIALAFWWCFARAPSRIESELGRELIAQHGLEAFCRALYNTHEFITVY